MCVCVSMYVRNHVTVSSLSQGLQGPPGPAGPHGDPGIPVSLFIFPIASMSYIIILNFVANSM